MASVTIARVRKASGLRFKAILRDELGRPLKSKTFTKPGSPGSGRGG